MARMGGLALAGAAISLSYDPALACSADNLGTLCRHLSAFAAATPLLAISAAPAPMSLDEVNRQLREANDRLRREVAAHETTLSELQSVRRDLERRVAERTKELRLVQAQYETALRGAEVTVFTQDRELRYTAISNAFLGRKAEEFLGRSDEEVMPEGSRDAIVAVKIEALESGAARRQEVRVNEGGVDLWFDLHVEPLRDGGGELIGLTCAAIDVTERKESEAQLRLLMRELTHRSKNLLAVIQAMARQTARGTTSLDRFVERFGARLQALATSHDLLVQEGWHGASLHELVRSQLGPYLDRAHPQITFEGPSVLFKPEAAQGLGLALHELATNAAKYGALSSPKGHVALVWRRLSPADGYGIEVVWRESGGPEVHTPEHRGFGTLAIERHLANTVDGDVELDFDPDGVRCRITVPVTQFVAAR